MKKFILTFALLIGVTSFYNSTASVQAQSINVNINIGRQPAWGPVGYNYADYYYFPEINCYYDVNVGMFYYVDRGYWVSARFLPYAYRNYDLYRLYKVVLNVRNPWRYNHVHYRDYGRYRGHNHRQVVIRDSWDHRYNKSRKNYVKWYSSDRYSVNRHDNRYNYNRNDNRYNNNRSDNRYNSRNDDRYNNNNNKSNNNYKKQDKQTSRPSYQGRDNSRSNSDRYKNENRGGQDYREKQKDNKQGNRPSMSNRSNDRSNNNRQSVQRNNERNDRNRSSSRNAEYKTVSNDRPARNR